MATHISFNSAAAAHGASDPAWYHAASQIGRFLRTISGKSYVTAAIGPDLCEGVGTAMYLPALREVHVNSDTCMRGIPPSSVHLTDPSFHLRAKPLIGALTHEAGHIRYSTFSMPELKASLKEEPLVYDTVILLEEARVESLMVRFRRGEFESARYGSDKSGSSDYRIRTYLRAAALEIAMNDFSLPDDTYGSAAAVALILMRAENKILTPGDVSAIEEAVVGRLGRKTVNELMSVGRAFCAIERGELVGIEGVALARRWLNILDIEPNDPAFQPSFDPAHMDGGDSSGDSGSGSSELEKHLEAESEKARNARLTEILEQQGKIETEARKEAGRLRRDSEQTAKRLSSTDFRTDRNIHNYQENFRPVPPELRQTAVRLSQQLRRLQYEDIARDRVSSSVPPGRLNARGALTVAAQRSLGHPVTADPFTARRKTFTPDVPLTVGIMVDVSGSMATAVRPTVEMSWVMAYAAHLADARTASVMFGDNVSIYRRPGEVPRLFLDTWEPSGATESFARGFQASNGLLDLIDGKGARILVMITDGDFVSAPERVAARTYMALCRRAGVEVIWFAPKIWHHCEEHGYGEILTEPEDGWENTAALSNELGDKIIGAYRRRRSLVA